MRVAACLLAFGWMLSPAVPAAPAQSALPPRAPVTQLETSFDLSQGVVRLDVDLGTSRAARLVFDTGNPTSILDLDAAKSLGLEPDLTQKKKMGTDPAAPEYYVVQPARARLGSEALPDLVFAASPLSQTLADTYGLTCDGTLGYGVFKGRVVQLDYAAHKLRLLDSFPAATAAAAPVAIHRLPAQKGGQPTLLTVDRLLVGGRPVVAQVDTFFAGSLVLFPAKVADVVPTEAKGEPPAAFAGTRLPAARLKEVVVLGGASLRPGETLYAARKEARAPQSELAAVLGDAFFRQCVVTLDLQGDRLLVTPGREDH